ncbi:MAG: helix-turn-helix transcriptional regulator [Clostridia bacterium]|nr:helix-turn-helix transcriptional regulator [Clostridia bacterium]
MEIFAERLKELRTEKGLSIQALSKEIKIGVASICRWENRQADVKGSQLVILAKYFDVTIDYLMGLEN